MKPVITDFDFEQAAEHMIKEKRHAHFMKQALKDYRAYQSFFSNAFLDEPSEDLFRIRATYRLQKNLWREIELLGTQSLANLASKIIESMEWDEDHLHGFWLPDARRNRFFGDYGIYHKDAEDEPFTKFKTTDIPVSQIDWSHHPILGLVFDFGAGHEFDITLKMRRPFKKSDKMNEFPRLIDQRGIAPEQYPEEEPEDGGSILFDDCSICQTQISALKEGRTLSLSELTEAFKKAKNGSIIKPSAKPKKEKPL